MDAAIPMSDFIADGEQSLIANAVWGPLSRVTEHSGKDRETSLEWYLRHYKDEEHLALSRNPRLLTTSSLSHLIRCLKANVKIDKRKLLNLVSEHGDQGEVEPHEVALGLAVRVAFMTACKSRSQETFGGDLFRPRWNETETLEAYIDRAYPRTSNQSALQDLRAIRIDKLAVGYLKSYAKLDLAWTHRLTDHLILLKRPNTKTLYIFRHPAFLQVSLATLEANGAWLGATTADSLERGCLPPELLKETLTTYSLLFPEPGDKLSQSILKNEVLKHSLDTSFLRPFLSPHVDHEHPQDAIDPEDVRNLYKKYPYWAERLYALWREADDPTPITLVERWSDSRKNPRFTYWCTVVSLTIAILFGIAATVLSALQVWISYCGWANDATMPLC